LFPCGYRKKEIGVKNSAQACGQRGHKAGLDMRCIIFVRNFPELLAKTRPGSAIEKTGAGAAVRTLEDPEESLFPL
jgi:hypothetical protein